MNKRLFFYFGLALFSVLGAMNAWYLASKTFAGAAPTCNFIEGCDVVLTSSYAYMLGVPLALYGVFFYVIVALFSLWGLADKGAPARRYLLPLTATGFAFSVYFISLQAFVIKAFCEYCLLSAFDATVLFVLSIFATKPARTILDYVEAKKETYTADVEQ